VSAPFKLQDIDHVVLRVCDVERMRRFYCDVLGCTFEKDQLGEFGLLQLRAGRSLIDLIDVTGEIGRRGGAAPGTQARNMDHVCLRVAPFDGEAIRRHLAGHGITPGELRDRYGADGYGPSIYLDDPEGNMVELKGPPRPDQ
jgi:catechol 2,3-dioxygenase-like lactoylglutathione lyase family enzyme